MFLLNHELSLRLLNGPVDLYNYCERFCRYVNKIMTSDITDIHAAKVYIALE